MQHQRLQSSACTQTVFSLHALKFFSAVIADISDTGGKRIGDKGYFIEPTVFADVKDDMKIAQVIAYAVQCAGGTILFCASLVCPAAS